MCNGAHSGPLKMTPPCRNTCPVVTAAAHARRGKGCLRSREADEQPHAAPYEADHEPRELDGATFGSAINEQVVRLRLAVAFDGELVRVARREVASLKVDSRHAHQRTAVQAEEPIARLQPARGGAVCLRRPHYA